MATSVHVDARYTADTSSYVRGAKEAQRATEQFARAMPEADRAMADVKASSVALGSALGLLAAQALTKATAKVKQFAMQGINAAKDYEQTVISIEGIFAGMGMSVEEATTKTAEYLADLRDFAAKTPFELPQTLTAVKRLLSIGYAADDVKDRLLPTIGDIVSALGQPPQSISAVVYAFGQMKSAGRVLTQDLMQIGNALPGFNAKMAIATEMFEGDMDAFNQAMEKGAVNSEEAIDAIISAMQKFGGAQGAMERQSETLAGVMSTFSDTVNNALIDGLMPSIPVLSATLNEVMPAVEGVATAFAQSLGPALIDGAKIMGEFAPTVAEIIPPIINLVAQLTVMADVFVAFTPVIEAAASVAGFFATALEKLPTPVFVAVGALLLMRLALKKLNTEAMMANAKVAGAMTKMKASVVSATDTMRLHLMFTGVSFKTAQIAAASFGRGIVASMRIAGTAIKGFMASLGPLGIAVIGVSVAMEVLMGKSASTEAIIEKLRDTTGEATTAINGLNVAAASAQFRADLSQEDIDLLESYGINLGEAAVAALKGGEAADEFRDKLVGVINSFGVNEGKLKKPFKVFEQNFLGMVQNAEAAIDANKALRESERDAARAAQEQAWATGRAVKELQTYRDAGVRAAVASGELDSGFDAAAGAAEELADEVAEVTGMFDYLLGTLSKIEAADNAAAALREIETAAKESGAGLMESGEKAEDFRSKVAGAIEASVAKAETLGETFEEQQRILQGEFVNIVTALRNSGIKDKDIEAFLGTFDQLPMSIDNILNAANIVAGEKTKTLATTAQKSVRDAFKTGEAVTADAAERLALAAADKAEDTLGINMSKQMNAAIDQVGAQVTPVMREQGYDLGYTIDQGLAAGIRENANYVDQAIRAMALRGVQEAKDILGIASPSKVFLQIGEDLMKGLELGVVKGAPGFSEAMARQWQDAVWAAEDAADRVVGAQKALDEARKEGNAREIAAAERALAQARRDAADATKALRLAEKDLNAVRELSAAGMGTKPFIKISEMLDAGDLEGAWDYLENVLFNRAKKFGLSGEAAAAYVEAAMGKVFAKTEKWQKRYNKWLMRLEKVRAQMEEVQQRIDDAARERESARSEMSAFIESIFGEESEFDKAYDAASINVDRAVDLYKDIAELVNQRFTDASDTSRRDDLLAFLTEQTEALVGLIRRRDSLMESLRAEQKKLDDMINERNRAEERLRSSIESFFKPSGKIASADEYITGLQQRVDATRQYMANIDDLRKRGVGASTIEQILSMGPEAGGSLAAALAGATDEQLEYVNSLTAQSETMAANFGKTQADIMYSAGITAQQELVNGLRAEYDEVIGEINTITDSIEAELSTLAESSYDIGMTVGEELMQGLLDREAYVLGQIEKIGDRIAKAWAKALGSAWTPNMGVSGSPGATRVGVVSAPMPIPSAISAMRVEQGAVQVNVTVGDGQNTQAVQQAVHSAVREALTEVDRRSRNARR